MAPALTHAQIQSDLTHFQREAIPYFDKKIKDIQRKIKEASKTRNVMRKRKGVLPPPGELNNLHKQPICRYDYTFVSTNCDFIHLHWVRVFVKFFT